MSEHTKGKWEARPYLAPADQWLVAGSEATALNRVAKMLDRGEKGEANARRICQCVNSHDDLLAACEVAVLALTHQPIHPDDIRFIKDAIAKSKI